MRRWGLTPLQSLILSASRISRTQGRQGHDQYPGTREACPESPWEPIDFSLTNEKMHNDYKSLDCPSSHFQCSFHKQSRGIVLKPLHALLHSYTSVFTLICPFSFLTTNEALSPVAQPCPSYKHKSPFKIFEPQYICT